MFGLFGKKQKRPKSGSREKAPVGKDHQTIALDQTIVEEVELSGGVGMGPEQSRRKPKNTKLNAWMEALRFASKWLGLWALVAVAGLLSHSAWIADETAFLAVAWEMWTTPEYLVPVFNGQPYPDIPPLMLWLTQLGWLAFGFNNWWPHMLPALFSLGTLLVLSWVARLFWPQQIEVGRYAPLILLGISAWAFYSTLMMTDMALVFFVTISLWCLALMGCRGSRVAGLFLGLALGLGALSNGMIVFWIVLPVALLAPLWVGKGSKVYLGIWYQHIALAMGIGVAILFCWFVPVADARGWPWVMTWLQHHLIPQPVALFDAAQPRLGYLVFLPMVLFPWSIWPLPWMRLYHLRSHARDSGLMFSLVLAASVIVLLMSLNVRQPQLLLPLFPFYALVIAYLMLNDDLKDHGEDSIWASMGFPLMAIGGLLAVLPQLPRTELFPEFLWKLNPIIGICVSVIGIAFAWAPSIKLRQRIMSIAVTSIMLVIFSILGAGWLYKDRGDVSEVTRYLAAVEAGDRPIAHVGRYHGQFHFTGALQKPFSLVSEEEVDAWAGYYPNGVIISYTGRWQPIQSVAPTFEATYGDNHVLIWDASSLIQYIP
ncbi:MAG: glycosyltransferase family 39 protein [Gammaproteobacteria bacterium]|nr:glycosyltransferase family 39 protein [Gammaproteobacteria bacterium]